MAKFYGNVGYIKTVETRPGIWEPEETVIKYVGELLKNTRRLQGFSGLTDNVVISNQISIISDAYARENYFSIRYAEWNGAKWKVTSVEVQHPRLILSLGELYNG